MGTNHSSGAERSVRNKFGRFFNNPKLLYFTLPMDKIGLVGIIKANIERMVFVCVTLISVKSKYGSCSGNCTGEINIKPPPSLTSLMVKQDTSNILIQVQFLGKIQT